MSNNYILSSDAYTVKNALLWGMCIEHCKKIPEGKLSTGARCHHIAMALMEFFPVIGQVVSLVELVAKRCLLYLENLNHRKQLRKQELQNQRMLSQNVGRNEVSRMIQEIQPNIGDQDRQKILESSLTRRTNWTKSDVITDESELKALYTRMSSPAWNPPGFPVRDFEIEYIRGYQSITYTVESFILESTDLRQIIAISALLVSREMKYLRLDPASYSDLTARGTSFAGLANNGVLHAWIAKAKELLDR